MCRCSLLCESQRGGCVLGERASEALRAAGECGCMCCLVDRLGDSKARGRCSYRPPF